MRIGGLGVGPRLERESGGKEARGGGGVGGRGKSAAVKGMVKRFLILFFLSINAK